MPRFLPSDRVADPVVARGAQPRVSGVLLCILRTLHIVAMVCAVLGIATVAHAQSALDGFNPGANNDVYALVVQPDGKILVGGDFTTLGGGGTGTTPRNRIGRLNADGSLDTSFNPGANGTVYAVAVQPDGKILVGGNFTTLGGGGTGTTARSRIARVNADGSLDTSFDPGANGAVNTVVVQADGKIAVGGDFTTLGGGGTGTTTRNRLGRLDAAGSLDASFDPGANSLVYALAVQPNGKILVGGYFTTLGGGGSGTTTRNRIGRLNVDGSLDPAFNPGANSWVQALAVQPDGKILVGGGFTALGGETGTTTRNYMGRLNADGSLDTSFDPGANQLVYGLSLQPDGKILVGGIFTTLGGGGTGTTARNKIGRLNADGSLDATFNPGANGDVYTVAVQADGKILAGGQFVGLGGGAGTTPRNQIGRLYPDGSVEADVNPGANTVVHAIAVQPDGKILLGGGFTALGGGTGTTPRNYIGRLNAGGSLDTSFNPGANNTVSNVALQPNGQILVGGYFTTLGGGGTGTAARNRIGRLNADGSLDDSFNPGVNGAVHVLIVQPNGQILVGGDFTMLGGGGSGITLRRSLGRLNADGSLDTSFDPGMDFETFSLALQPDGKILVGGGFSRLGGGGTGTTPRNGIGRLHADGTLDVSFNPGIAGSCCVRALAVQADGKILVGGAFSGLGGGTGTTTRKNIGRLNADGSLDTSFDPGANDEVESIAVQADGKILVGGWFTGLGGGTGTTTRNYIGRLNAAGSLDPDFNPGANGFVFDLAMQSDGKILVGGFFNTLGGGGTGTTTRNRIGRLTNTDAAIQSLSVTGSGSIVTWSRSGAAPEVWRVTFESSTDGVTYTSLGNGTRVTGGWQLGGLSLPTLQNLFVRARGYYGTGLQNGSGSVVESIRNVYLTIAPAIATQPSNQTVTAGANATFTVAASGNPTPTVQWQVSTNSGSTWTDLTNTAPYSGVTTATLTITSAAVSLSGNQYRAVATNSAGTATSTGATLTVNTVPAITTQPANQTVTAGGTATFTAAASGSPTPTVQWQASTNSGSTWTDLTNTSPYSGVTTVTLTITSAAASLSGNQYRAVATNGAGTATSTGATLTVNTVPAITTQPANQTVTAGATASFTVAASGNPAPTVQWQVSTNGGSSFSDISGATATTYSLTTGAADNGKQVRAAFTNSVGTATSNAATLTVTPLTMSLDKTALVFGATTNGASFIAKTSTQPVRLTQSGTGTVTWTAASNQPWLAVSPAAGTGSGTLDVSVQFAAGLSGNPTGSITLTFTGAANTAGPINVTLNLINDGTSTSPVGSFDTPADGTSGVTGSIAVTGWALDDVEVTGVRILRDPIAGEPAGTLVFIGNAVLVDGARPDVQALYPASPRNTRAGWGYLMLTNFLPGLGNGTFRLTAIADDADGHSTTLGTKTITCSNSTATAPTGAIDTPAQGGTVSGTVTNFGWVLSPSPRRADPPSGGTVRVVVNGAFLSAVPSGWTSRADLTALFPVAQFPGIVNALGVATFDSVPLGNGVHTISWVVTDNLGSASGIGSRYFTVSNGSLVLDPTPGSVTSPRSPVIGGPTSLAMPRAAALRIDSAAALASAVAAAPRDDAAIQGRRGFNLDTPVQAYAVRGGRATVQAEELDRLELQVEGVDGLEGLEGPGRRGDGSVTGYLRVAGGLAPLPIGSALDAATGAFTWAPGVGFVGPYDLVFVRWSGGEAVARQDVRVVLNPKGSNRVGPQVVIDVPAVALAEAGLRASSLDPVASPFKGAIVVAGWAADLDSTIDRGVDAVHVWAYPVTVGSVNAGRHGDPIWIGAATYGGARPDVAGVYGDRFLSSGYGITVGDLAPGTYDIAVFAYSTVIGGFAPAKTIRVSVR